MLTHRRSYSGTVAGYPIGCHSKEGVNSPREDILWRYGEYGWFGPPPLRRKPPKLQIMEIASVNESGVRIWPQLEAIIDQARVCGLD